MIEVKICVGSCCFSQGAGEFIKFYEENKDNEMSGVDLSGSFCLGKCGKGITISLEGKLYKVKSLDKFKELMVKAKKQ